ncbi:hypothetical protein B0A48_18715 [Cryoendolithus antarcticus]|uniref:Heterokaryon incompatibility domain-containing protein n=1 Tax=Cryoendolithus antarcticus TaxID=1507870 RepID=A0A1V8S896_9PEZI|nr:hypothetical protein B0A48_18715 [Cryoendolithus antarcticus]
MRHLQSSAYVVTVWADALSINQVDNIEKAHQIRRMHDIYSRAQSTVVWLGPEADGSDMAMKVPLRTGSEARELGLLDHTALALNNGFQNRDPEFQGLRSMIDEIGWLYPFKAVRELFERPYWSRLWVLQEYALATKIEVRCGRNIIDGDQFNAGYLLLPMLQKSLMESARDADFFEPVRAGADYEVDTNQDGHPISRLEHLHNNTVIADRAGNLVEARNLYESWQIKADVTPQERLCILLERTNTGGPES